ncbi:hypothetical protein CRG98_032776 [Punica granatum]|uniref:Uncharacterized protein n=1 Tax=Punica granatum TaxID=22663 RepID=A0A2I0IS62_PUNGR|nr:hypothetical protein CRG98_032776 [Punica granatum]
MKAFQRGSRNEDFTKSLIITPPNSFANISARARKLMVVKESVSVWKKKEHVVILDREINPLNAPKAVVLNEIEWLGIGTPPQVKKKGDIGNDPNSYCRYPKARGHNTEDCKTLKVDIERLIQAGHLRSFIQKGGRKDRARSPCHGRSPSRREKPDLYCSKRSKFCEDFASRVIP